MSHFSKSIAAGIALTLSTLPASAVVVDQNHRCTPPKEWYDGPFGGGCVTPIKAYKAGPLDDQTITLTPDPDSHVTVEGIFKKLGRPADAAVKTDMFGTKSLELKGVKEHEIPGILNSLGINKQDIQ
jgi:hypothetical protein